MPGPHSRRKDHPYLIERLQDLPANLQPLADRTALADRGAETIFVMPAQSLPKNFSGRGGMRLAPDRALLFTDEGVWYLEDAEASGKPGQASYLSGSQLLSTRLIQILLYGRLEFYGAEGETLKSIVVEYNSVGQDLLQPALQRLLRLTWDASPTRPAPGDDHTDALLQTLGEQSFKFRNGLREYALQPGERLLDFVFQPRIIRRALGIFPQLAIPAALLALTENEILLLEEGRTNATSYGWFVTFCPRRYVANVEARPNARWQNVQIELKKGRITTAYQVTVTPEIAQRGVSLLTTGGSANPQNSPAPRRGGQGQLSGLGR